MTARAETADIIPTEMSHILEIVASGRRMPWWEIHRWHVDVYGGGTRPAEFRKELETLQSGGYLRYCGDDTFELTEKGRPLLPH